MNSYAEQNIAKNSRFTVSEVHDCYPKYFGAKNKYGRQIFLRKENEAEKLNIISHESVQQMSAT